MPLFISKLLLSINATPNIKNTLEKFIQELNSLGHYYETTCPKCNTVGTISKVIFDKPERTGSNITIKAINYSCSCTKKGVKSPDKTDYTKLKATRKLKNVTSTSLLYNSKIAVTENDDIKNILQVEIFLF